jgi:hypothetical protein
MNRNSTRATAIVGTTMALVIAGTAAVSAAGPRNDDRGRGPAGPGKAGIGAQQGGAMMPGARGMGGMRGLDADFERSETTIQTTDGTTSMRVEKGVADTATDAGLSFSLGSGEAVTVVIDGDTRIVAFEEQEVTSNRGWSRTRLAPSEVEAAAIEVGAEIVVWSHSEDDADFVASRIVIHPAVDTEDADAEEAEAGDVAEEAAEAVEETTEEAAATDA